MITNSPKHVVLGPAHARQVGVTVDELDVRVRRDNGPSVSRSYTGPFPFTGTLISVTYVSDDDREDACQSRRGPSSDPPVGVVGLNVGPRRLGG